MSEYIFVNFAIKSAFKIDQRVLSIYLDTILLPELYAFSKKSVNLTSQTDMLWALNDFVWKKNFTILFISYRCIK